MARIKYKEAIELEIRTKTKVKRIDIIRALIAGLMRFGMDLSTFGTKEDIAVAIQERLKG
jgi:hypothetical protein